MNFNVSDLVKRSFMFHPNINEVPEGGGAPAPGSSPLGGGESSGTAPDGEPVGAPPSEKPSQTVISQKIDIKNYRGSKKVNPDQRPLKNFVRDGMNPKQIDALISEAGSEIFLSAEQIAEIEKKNAEVPKDEKETPSEKSKEKETDVSDKKDEDDPEVKEFFEKTGLNEKDFSALPTAAQESLAKAFSTMTESSGKHSELEKKYNQLFADVTESNKDAVIAARLEEISTGKAYVATQLPKFTQTEISELDTLLTDGNSTGAIEYLNKWVAAKAQDAIKHERSVIDKQVFRKTAEAKARDIFIEVGKLDPRLAIEEND
jgi:hypothetical protein